MVPIPSSEEQRGEPRLISGSDNDDFSNLLKEALREYRARAAAQSANNGP